MKKGFILFSTNIWSCKYRTFTFYLQKRLKTFCVKVAEYIILNEILLTIDEMLYKNAISLVLRG